MKIRIMLNTIKVCIVILVALFQYIGVEVLADNTTSKFYPVDPNRVPQILNMIVNRVHDNYNKIRTWQGKKNVIMDYIDEEDAAEKTFKKYTEGKGTVPNKLRRRVICTTEFALDLKKDFLHVGTYWNKYARYVDTESGKDLGAKSAHDPFKKSIITPEYYIYCSPNTRRDGTIINHKVVKESPEECQTCNNASVFDPRGLFGLPQPIWITFPQIIQVISKHGEYNVDGYTLEIEECKDGSAIKYRIKKPGKVNPNPEDNSDLKNYLFLTRTFSSVKGFNIISYEATFADGRPLLKRTWDYELIDGIYLPSKTTEQNYKPDTGHIRYSKESTFKNQKINKPIAAETFTYRNLGLKDGDEFIDKIAGKKFKYQDGELIELEKESPAAVDSNKPEQKE